MVAYIQAQHLIHHYGATCALDDISFNIYAGDIVAIIGKNGAGKSTLLKLIAGTIPSKRAHVLLNGVSLYQQPHRAKKLIGFLSDKPALHYDVTVMDFLLFIGELRGLHGSILHHRVNAVIEQCQLHDFRKTLIGLLSSGYQQRVGFAEAIIHDPKVLILDEPTARLDAGQIDEFRDIIRSLAEDRAILLATHLMGDIMSMCNRILLLDKGRLCLDGTPQDVLNDESSLTLELTFGKPPTLKELEDVPGVSSVEALHEKRFRVACHERTQALSEIVLVSKKNEWELRNIAETDTTLGQFFEKQGSV